MRFLIDNLLPAALAHSLASHGHEAVHVLDVGLDASLDADIWRFACEQVT